MNGFVVVAVVAVVAVADDDAENFDGVVAAVVFDARGRADGAPNSNGCVDVDAPVVAAVAADARAAGVAGAEATFATTKCTITHKRARVAATTKTTINTNQHA